MLWGSEGAPWRIFMRIGRCTLNDFYEVWSVHLEGFCNILPTLTAHNGSASVSQPRFKASDYLQQEFLFHLLLQISLIFNPFHCLVDIQFCATMSCNDEFELLILLYWQKLAIIDNDKLETTNTNRNRNKCDRIPKATCLPNYLSLRTRSLRGLLRAFWASGQSPPSIFTWTLTLFKIPSLYFAFDLFLHESPCPQLSNVAFLHSPGIFQTQTVPCIDPQWTPEEDMQ